MCTRVSVCERERMCVCERDREIERERKGVCVCVKQIRWSLMLFDYTAANPNNIYGNAYHYKAVT